MHTDKEPVKRMSETMGALLPTGDIACTTDAKCDYFPNPDQALVVGSSVADLAALAGDNASGTWQLCVGDSHYVLFSSSGTFNAWKLTVTATPPSE